MEKRKFRNGFGRKGSPKPWLPWYPQHWLADLDVQGLTLTAQGVYMNFLMASWSSSPCRGAMDDRAMTAFRHSIAPHLSRGCRGFDEIWSQICHAKLVSPLSGGGWYSRRIVREHGDLQESDGPAKLQGSDAGPQHQRTDPHQKESRKEQTVRNDDLHPTGGLFSPLALSQMVEGIGGKQFHSPLWRRRLLNIFARPGAAGELIYALEKVENSLAGRGELKIQDVGAYVGELVMRLAGERKKTQGERK